jgi:DNA polymerase-3 subunit beta
MNAEEFPALPEPGDIQTFKVPADALIQMIDRTLFCVSTDDNRHNLSGVYCESTESGLLRMVATDGHRLALSEHQFDCDISLKQGVIVPRKGFQELKRVLSDGDTTKEVELGFSERNGILKTDSVTLTTRLVEGRFPDYQQVIQSSSNKTLKVSKPRLAEALKRVSLLSQGRAWGVRLSLSTDTLDLVAEDPEFGDAHETLAVDYQSEDLTIGFNARYLLDVLQLIKDDTVTLMLTDELSPGIIRPLEEQGFLAVVMPVRI